MLQQFITEPLYYYTPFDGKLPVAGCADVFKIAGSEPAADKILVTMYEKYKIQRSTQHERHELRHRWYVELGEELRIATIVVSWR